MSSGLSRADGLSSGWPLKRGSSVYMYRYILVRSSNSDYNAGQNLFRGTYNNGDNCCFSLPEPGSCCKRPAISKHLYSDLSMTGINTERQLAQMRLITCNVIDGSELNVLFISSLLTSFNINTCYTPCQVEHL